MGKVKKVLSYIFQVPLWLVMLSSIGAGFYAAYTNLAGITFATPIILIIISGLYVAGRVMSSKKDKEKGEY